MSVPNHLGQMTLTVMSPVDPVALPPRWNTDSEDSIWIDCGKKLCCKSGLHFLHDTLVKLQSALRFEVDVSRGECPICQSIR